MQYGAQLLVPPAYEPVSVEELEAHLRLNTDDESDLLADYITVARLMIEDYTGRQLMPAAWKLTFDEWPEQLPKAPTTAITDVSYYNTANVLVSDFTDYTVDLTQTPARFLPTPAADPFRWDGERPFPKLGARRPAVAITVECGTTDLPATLRHAVLLLAGNNYLFRTGSLPTLGTIRDIPYGLKAILAHYRVWC